MEYFFAIDVGGTFIKYAVVDSEGNIIIKKQTTSVTDDLDKLIALMEDIYLAETNKYSISGVALSMPGIIDSRSGFMYTGGNIVCIDKINIVDLLQKRLGICVSVENDAKCAALAEIWKGVLSDCNDAVVLVCGTGIGGAVIENRKVRTGTNFMCGEFSYIINNSHFPSNLEDTLAENAGVNALIRYVSQETGIGAELLDGIKIFELVNGGNDGAKRGLEKYVHNIAVQIHNYQYILDPEKFAIGGGISVEPLFIDMLRHEVKMINQIYPWQLPIPKIYACRFFNDANLIGAVYSHISSRREYQ